MDSQPGPSRKRVRVTDSDFEQTVTQWYEESDDENWSEKSDAEAILSDHNSDSEQSAADSEGQENSEIEESLDGDVNEYFYGKNKFCWSRKPLASSRSRTPRQNIVIQLPGLRPPLRNKTSLTEKEAWTALFSEEMLELIVKYSNQKLAKMRQKYKDPTKSDLRDLDIIELNGFLGLLIYTAAFRSNHENIRSLFATDGTGRDIFRCVMNINRYAILLQALRFDDADTREERKQNNPTAAVSEIFEKFVNNCQSSYSIGALACVDEMLISFRGRSKFKMYIPNKPCKYGLKLMALTDARNNYFLNGYIYCGKDSDGHGLSEEEKTLSKPTQAVLRLTAPIQNTNRNITADNWFTSVELVNILREKKLTYVGTIRRNKPQIPPEFLPARKRIIGSSVYGYSENITLLSYVPKTNKAVLLVSSMHSLPAQDPEVNKPEIISFYNNSKAGVDTLDQKCAIYSTGRRTRRWPMAIFFRILDICGANAFIIFSNTKDNIEETRLDFMKNLAKQLVTEELERRQGNPRLRQEVKLSIGNILGKESKEAEEQEMSTKLAVRKYCYNCPKKLKRKTSTLCRKCRQPVCLQCSSVICNTC